MSTEKFIFTEEYIKPLLFLTRLLPMSVVTYEEKLMVVYDEDGVTYIIIPFLQDLQVFYGSKLLLSCDRGKLTPFKLISICLEYIREHYLRDIKGSTKRQVIF